jgi:nitrite reductase/ring-hydroxylating ferredoxin subunit
MAQSSPSPRDGPSPADAQLERRGFFSRTGAIVVGGLIGLVPAASALAVFFDPLRRSGRQSKFLRVAPVSAVPDDGVPRQFPVIAEHVDAWTRSLEPVGAVYLRRQQGAAAPECLSATCPHAGCFVAYDGETNTFKCPCHNSSFEPDGAIIPPSPSPRSMDTLDCQVQQDEVLVKFENFYAGKSEKIVKQ